MNTKELDNKYIAATYARFPIEITSGKGSALQDSEGKEYIDMGTGIAVNTFGFSDDEWIKATTEQLTKFQHTSNLYYSSPCAMLAQALCKKTDMKKVFFSNSGAEANECAIKAARKYGAEKHGSDSIITLNGSFHGRTITTLAATGQETFHKDFLPLTEGFLYADANMESVLCVANGKKVAAVMIESVQGEGGVNPLDYDFVKALYDYTQKNDILLICDEVQSGNGRTGKLYGYMHFGITPDIVTTAKGLGGGLPIGATMLGEKVMDIFAPGSHGSTFGGNPVCCAGALCILQRIDDELLSEVSAKSKYIFSELSGAEGIKSVTGLGLMIGIETEKDASQVINDCIKKGVLPIKAKNKVRLLPALNIPWELLEKAVKIIKETCAEKGV